MTVGRSDGPHAAGSISSVSTNSGGPVFKPCRTTVGQGQVEADCLIGMVKAYMPYTDSALSRQTGKVRVTFEENSGLAVVVPVESIQQAIAEYLKSQ